MGIHMSNEKSSWRWSNRAQPQAATGVGQREFQRLVQARKLRLPDFLVDRSILCDNCQQKFTIGIGRPYLFKPVKTECRDCTRARKCGAKNVLIGLNGSAYLNGLEGDAFLRIPKDHIHDVITANRHVLGGTHGANVENRCQVFLAWFERRQKFARGHVGLPLDPFSRRKYLGKDHRVDPYPRTQNDANAPIVCIGVMGFCGRTTADCSLDVLVGQHTLLSVGVTRASESDQDASEGEYGAAKRHGWPSFWFRSRS